jgi:transposase
LWLLGAGLWAGADVKRQKNDMADAEAICEAVTRANMRFVPTKTPEQQSCGDLRSSLKVLDMGVRPRREARLQKRRWRSSLP